METFAGRDKIKLYSLASNRADDANSPDYLDYYVQRNKETPILCPSIKDAWAVHRDLVGQSIKGE